ncbi:MAG TPA: hypothetical protein DE036_03140 [Actinobacteria bacterium]|nr:hypothetical protein [Actinomycetota bacterium]
MSAPSPTSPTYDTTFNKNGCSTVEPRYAQAKPHAPSERANSNNAQSAGMTINLPMPAYRFITGQVAVAKRTNALDSARLSEIQAI